MVHSAYGDDLGQLNMLLNFVVVEIGHELGWFFQ